ncbi:Phloem protein 2-like [Thalictrum thalictroides]|uniref:Phloem protein 2-like n=1 Tax=Thalictrum thalictroides TaxID=46969 RepID=A0A7J6WIN1_THATH|nr:Phloem protein 2-like [Thalictrum thalictroides]
MAKRSSSIVSVPTTSATKPHYDGDPNEIEQVRLKQDAFGWDKLPIHIIAKIGKKGKYKWQTHFLDIVEHPDRKFPLSLDEIEVTDAHLKDENDILYFGLYEVWRGRWKGGLVLEEAILTKQPEEATLTIHQTS